MKLTVLFAVMLAVGSFAASTAVGHAGDGSFVAHIRQGAVKVDARITLLETDPSTGVEVFQIDVTRISGISAGAIGLSAGSDGSCYCGVRGVASFSVEGTTRNVLSFAQGWLSPDGSSPCGLILLDDTQTVIASAGFRTTGCR